MGAPGTVHHPVAVIGAGPVGLFLGCRLRQLGVDCAVFERSAAPVAHSRSIGVHPPSLERLARMELADAFVRHGVRIRQGVAFGDGGRLLGRLSFENCKPPYNYILSLPQYRTESLLEEALDARHGVVIRRGVRVEACVDEGDRVWVRARGADGAEIRETASVVVGCDGLHSVVRNAMRARMHDRYYKDVYTMGDFSDRSGWGAAACIHLCREGVVESFPLSSHGRRWVLKTQRYAPELDRDTFCAQVRSRTGYDLAREQASSLNAFRVHRGLATSFARGRLVLAGDAAHVMSPIGGQGMNVGWLNAWDLAGRLAAVLVNGREREVALQAYAVRARRRALRAARRAEFNMALGRRCRACWARNALVAFLLHSPLRWVLARVFTMRGL